jgi:hypothetical protein
MAGIPLVNCKIYVGGLDLSGDSNSLNLVHSAEMLDGTVFQPSSVNRTRSYTPGLKTIELSANMFWNIDVDDRLFTRIGLANEVASVAALGETEGDRVFFTRGIRGQYNPLSGEVGQIITAQLDVKNAGFDLVRGSLMASGSKSSSSTSTGLNLGSAANKRVFSALHVVSPLTAGAPTFAGIIQSDDNSGFTTPTTRLTHTTMTEDGADWQQATIGAGVTDNWWRASWTITGGGTFGIFWSFGIL